MSIQLSRITNDRYNEVSEVIEKYLVLCDCFYDNKVHRFYPRNCTNPYAECRLALDSTRAHFYTYQQLCNLLTEKWTNTRLVLDGIERSNIILYSNAMKTLLDETIFEERSFFEEPIKFYISQNVWYKTRSISGQKLDEYMQHLLNQSGTRFFVNMSSNEIMLAKWILASFGKQFKSFEHIPNKEKYNPTNLLFIHESITEGIISSIFTRASFDEIAENLGSEHPLCHRAAENLIQQPHYDYGDMIAIYNYVNDEDIRVNAANEFIDNGYFHINDLIRMKFFYEDRRLHSQKLTNMLRKGAYKIMNQEDYDGISVVVIWTHFTNYKGCEDIPTIAVNKFFEKQSMTIKDLRDIFRDKEIFNDNNHILTRAANKFFKTYKNFTRDMFTKICKEFENSEEICNEAVMRFLERRAISVDDMKAVDDIVKINNLANQNLIAAIETARSKIRRV